MSIEDYLNKWRNYTLQEGVEEYEEGGKVKLYHFSPSIVANAVTLDPQRFISSRNAWSRKESQISSFPRVFFYLDKEKTEPGIGNGTPFVATVDVDDIYDIVKDEENLLQKSKKATFQTVPNYDKVFKALSGKDKPTPGYESSFTPIRDEDSKIYKGVSYSIGGGKIPVVVWFEEIEAQLESDVENENEEERNDK
jgi:hypothetical protein